MSHAAPKTVSGVAAATDYERFRALFFSALAGLARRGYVAAPDEGLDLIHDFFVEAWPTIVERHDPNLSRFSTYAYKAFVQFARPRIVRLRRWGRQLDVPPPESETDVETSIDIARMQNAFATLGKRDRELLEARFVLGRSEREIAQSLGTTRYRTREMLVGALAGLVSALQDKALTESSTWAIAVGLWRDGRSMADVAASMNLTESQVRARKRKLLEALTQAAPGMGGPRREIWLANQ